VSKEGETNVAEKLMGALISKMETMDSDLQSLKGENASLRKALENPAVLLKRAGFVAARNNMPEDVFPDEFRGSDILKGDNLNGIDLPRTNEDFHNMEWADIHALAEQAKSAGAIGNELGME
jgi:hypothetical protein